MTDARVVVIGGGFAGVAAAVRLRDRGARVTLIEERRMLGGRARSDVLDDVPIDTGAQLITTGYARTVQLLGAHLERDVAHDIVVRNGERLPLRFGSLRSLLGFSGLSAREKVRLATSLLPLLARHREALDASGARLPESLDTESVRSYVERRIGAAAADTLAEPPCNGFYNVAASDVSLAFFLSLGRYGSEGDTLAPMRSWSDALGAALVGIEVITDARVVAVNADSGGGRTSRVSVHDATGRTWDAAAVVIATDPRTAHDLIAPHLGIDHALAHWLATVPMRGTLTLALALDCAPPHDAFGVFQDVRVARTVSACAVHGAKRPRVRADRDVVLAWPAPRALDAMRDMSAESITAHMLPDVEALVPQVRGHITRARVYRFNHGSPIPFIGFVRDRARASALLNSIDLPIALAGDYLTTPLIEGAVASGEFAGERIAKRIGLA
jgi:protoporphyrinogen oxidase